MEHISARRPIVIALASAVGSGQDLNLKECLMNAVNDNYKPALVIPPAEIYAGVDTFLMAKTC